jgi:hypothetical protein
MAWQVSLRQLLAAAERPVARTMFIWQVYHTLNMVCVLYGVLRVFIWQVSSAKFAEVFLYGAGWGLGSVTFGVGTSKARPRPPSRC